VYTQKPPPVASHRRSRCASRRAPKGAVEERIHRLDDGVPIGLFARHEQAAASETLDVPIVQFQPIAAKAVGRRYRLRLIRSAAPPRAVLVFATVGVATLWFTGRLLRAIFYSFSCARRRPSRRGYARTPVIISPLWLEALPVAKVSSGMT
jgi:hypothetical protein